MSSQGNRYHGGLPARRNNNAARAAPPHAPKAATEAVHAQGQLAILLHLAIGAAQACRQTNLSRQCLESASASWRSASAASASRGLASAASASHRLETASASASSHFASASVPWRLTFAAPAFCRLASAVSDHAYLAGDRLFLADIPIGALMYRYANLEVTDDLPPSVARWYSALTEREAFQTHVMIPFDELKGRLAF